MSSLLDNTFADGAVRKAMTGSEDKRMKMISDGRDWNLWMMFVDEFYQENRHKSFGHTMEAQLRVHKRFWIKS